MDPSELVKVAGIKIKIGSWEKEFTPKEARSLRDALNELLGPNPAAPIYIPEAPCPIIDTWFADLPIWVNPNAEPWPCKWTVTAGPLRQSAVLNISV